MGNKIENLLLLNAVYRITERSAVQLIQETYVGQWVADKSVCHFFFTLRILRLQLPFAGCARSDLTFSSPFGVLLSLVEFLLHANVFFIHFHVIYNSINRLLFILLPRKSNISPEIIEHQF